MGDVLYLCDLKACDPCPHTECKHTSDISHAVNFERVGTDAYFEKEKTMPITESEYEEVYFNEYCPKCRHEKVDDTKGKAPCHECLSEPVNLGSHKPVKYEEK